MVGMRPACLPDVVVGADLGGEVELDAVCERPDCLPDVVGADLGGEIELCVVVCELAEEEEEEAEEEEEEGAEAPIRGKCMDLDLEERRVGDLARDGGVGSWW